MREEIRCSLRKGDYGRCTSPLSVRVSDGGRQVSPGLFLKLAMTFRLVTGQVKGARPATLRRHGRSVTCHKAAVHLRAHMGRVAVAGELTLALGAGLGLLGLW